MQDIRKDFLSELSRVEQAYQIAEHLTVVTYPVVKDGKLLLRALEKLSEGITKNISLILRAEYFYRRISLTKDPARNLQAFFDRCAGRYGLEEGEQESVRKILLLQRRHKESGFEFSKSGRVVIMDDFLGTAYLDLEGMKEFLKASKKLLQNTNINFKAVF